VAGLRFAPETPRLAQRELDLTGQTAAVIALGVLAGALIEAGQKGWQHPLVLTGFAVAAASAALFIGQERRAAQPMLPLSLFGRRMFALTALVAFWSTSPSMGCCSC
jgi:hypothetical protein